MLILDLAHFPTFTSHPTDTHALSLLDTNRLTQSSCPYWKRDLKICRIGSNLEMSNLSDYNAIIKEKKKKLQTYPDSTGIQFCGRRSVLIRGK